MVEATRVRLPDEFERLKGDLAAVAATIATSISSGALVMK